MPSRQEFDSHRTNGDATIVDEETLVIKNASNAEKNLNFNKSVNQQRNPFPKSIWACILLIEVFLYGCYPLYIKFSKVGNEIKYSTASLVLLIESGKLFFSLVNIYPLWKKDLVEKQPLIVWLAFAVPAMLYCFNNNVAILVQRYFDPASYVIISNLKIPTTAVMYRIVMKRPLTWIKWFAVALLTIAGISNSLGNLVSDDKVQDRANDVHVTVTGLSILALYCIVSAFAGIWTELIVKRQYEVSIHQQNCMLYTFGVLFNLLTFFWMEINSPHEPFKGGSTNLLWQLKNFFHDFNKWVIVLVCSEVCSGLIISAIMKYASNITRLFVTSTAMVVTTLLSYALFNFSLNVYLIGSLTTVIVALYLYNRN